MPSRPPPLRPNQFDLRTNRIPPPTKSRGTTGVRGGAVLWHL